MAHHEDSRFYREARDRVHRRFHFYQHLAVFGLVGLVLLTVDVLHHLIEGGGEPFVPWVAGIWGSILAGHFIYTFVIAEWLGTEARSRVTEREIRRLEGRLSGDR